MRGELGERLGVDLELIGAHRAEGERVEDQDGRLPEQVLLREALPVGGGQREVGDLGPRRDDAHLRRPRSLISSR